MQCRICGCHLTADRAASCGRCSAAFHSDCWEYNGGCGIFGCGGTTSVPFHQQHSDELVAIDVDTRPPWRVEPYVEAFVRRLPRWGRTFVPAFFLSLLGAIIIFFVALHSMGRPLARTAPWLIGSSSVVIAFLASLFGPTIRRRPGLSAVCSSLFTCCFAWAHLTRTLLSRDVAAGGIIVWATVAASCLVELLAGSSHLVDGGGSRRAVSRALATALCLYGLMSLLRYAAPGLGIGSDEVPIVALFGLFVTAPPLELSKSALMHRLKAEAAREAEEDKQSEVTS